MIIDVNLKEKLVIKNLLLKHMGWIQPTYISTYDNKQHNHYFIESPSGSVRFCNNSFTQINASSVMQGFLDFKISYFNKIQLDTTKKLLVFGDNLFAVDVS